VTFYEQLSLSTSQQPFTPTSDVSKSILFNVSTANASSYHQPFVRRKGVKGLEGDGDVRRHIERLLLRLDFNEGFSKAKILKSRAVADRDILKDGGLA
jgi:gamma-tubulin complex component 4